MKKKILTIMVIGLLFASTVSAAITVSVSNPSCKYAITVPEGWDTIPQNILKEKLQQFNVDLGLYPVSQGEYFNGNYALVAFAPTINGLNKFTFEQIVSDVTKLNRQSEVKNDTLQVHFDKIVPVLQDSVYSIQSYFSALKDTISLENSQTLYLTKFGYISVLSYKKPTGLLSLEDVNSQLADIIQIQPDYKYVEPVKKGLSLKHILLSLGIGLLVYGLIAYFPKFKKRPE